LRHVPKGNEPTELRRRREELLDTPGITDYYKHLDYARDALITRCSKDQGGICAYTMVRVSNDRGHLEHLFPQKADPPEVRNPLEAIQFENIVLCYPQPNATVEPGFGARKKDHWPSLAERNLFLKPTDPTCEDRIRYGSDGKIWATSDDDEATKTTIEKLELTHETLMAWRRESLAPLRELREASLIKKRIAALRARGGEAEEYCVAKWQVLERKLARVQAIRGL
jgi:uncharacterized protein (TIGR02646 family)